MKSLVISTSLNPDSRSAVLAKRAWELLNKINGTEVDWVDLREVPLPMCDGAVDAHSDPNVEKLKQRIEAASGLLLSIPIYNFSISASAKNLLELTGQAWRGKTIGFLCAAGGRVSYMSVMNFANSLMLDYRCTIVPDFVYASEDDFDRESIINEQVKLRLEELAKKFNSFVEVLDGV